MSFGSWNDYFRFRWRLRVLRGYDICNNIYGGSTLVCSLLPAVNPFFWISEYVWGCKQQTYNPSIVGVSSHAIEEIKKIYLPAKQIQISMKNKIKKESTAYLKIFVLFCFFSFALIGNSKILFTLIEFLRIFRGSMKSTFFEKV